MTVRLRDLAAVLAANGDMVADELDLDFDTEAGRLQVTLQVPGGTDVVELYMALRQVRDLAQARSLSERYNIPMDALERYITGGR